jgi:hypothetical protein
MSIFDPFENLKKNKKTNIFDYSAQNTSVPTETPANQYMTPVPQMSQVPQQQVTQQIKQQKPVDF